MRIARPLYSSELPEPYRGEHRRELTPFERAMNAALLGDPPLGYHENAERLRAQHAEADVKYRANLEQRKPPSRRNRRRRSAK